MKRWVFWLWLIVVVALLWFLRPWYHGLVMSVYVHPLVLLAWLILLFGSRLIWHSIKNINRQQDLEASKRNMLGLGFLVVFVIIISVIGSIEEEIRKTVTINNLAYETRKSLPTLQPVRLMPKEVATRIASDAFQNSQEYLGDSQIVLIDDELMRVFPRLPDGGFLYLTKKLNGFVTVDVSTLERQVKIEDEQFRYSEGIGIFDNLYFRLYKEKYFVDFVPEPIYLKDDTGRWMTVVPYISYDGFLVRTPVWGGFVLVYPDGRIEDHAPETVADFPWLKGNRVFPKELARYYAESFAYRKGLINKWFLHEDQIEIIDPPDAQMPFHVATDEGFKQFIAAKPTGDSFGMFKLFIFDASTGALELIEYPADSLLTGPTVAADYILQQFPLIDWFSFYLAEPRPVTVENRLYWLLSIVPNDAAGVSKTVMLDADTNEVFEFDTAAAVQRFLQGEADIQDLKAPDPDLSQTDSRAAETQQILRKITELETVLDELRSLVEQDDLRQPPQ